MRMEMSNWYDLFNAIDQNWPRSRELSIDELDQVFEWCDKNCEGLWWAGPTVGSYNRVYVKEDKDAVLFLLRWG